MNIELLTQKCTNKILTSRRW